MTEKYLPYCLALAVALLCALPALLLLLRAERGVERSRKPLSWVRAYRSGAGLDGLDPRGAKLLPLIPVVLYALTVSLALFWLKKGEAEFEPGLHLVGRSLLAMLGAAAAYLLLRLLFGSTKVSVLGSLLFASALHSTHSAFCLLTVSALLLLYWLRTQKNRWYAELLYAAVVLSYAAALARAPRLLWLLPLPVVLHWYKNLRALRAGQLSLWRFVGSLALALLWWVLGAVLFIALRELLAHGLQGLSDLLTANGRTDAVQTAWLSVQKNLFRPLWNVKSFTYLLLDAPLLALGLCGAVSALRAAIKRRSVRGVFALTAFACLALVWLLSSYYALSLGLLLTTGCLLHQSVIGKRKVLPVLAAVLGIVYSLALAAAAWALPIEQILNRIA